MGKSAPATDNSGVVAAQASADAAKEQYQLGDDQLAFEKQQYADDQPLITEAANSDIQSQNQTNAFATEQQNYYTGNYQPLETSYLNKVENYDTPAQEQLNAGAAQGSVMTQANGARSAAMEQLEGFGVDPTSTRYASLDIGTATGAAAAAAGAGTSAIQNTKMQGLGLEAGAINTGRGYANNEAGLANAGTSSGAGASSALTGALGTGANALASTSAFTNAGTGAMGTYVNAVNGFNYSQNQAAQINAESSAGIGSIFGGLAGMIKFEDGGAVDGASGAIPMPGGGTPGGAVPMGASPTAGQASDDVPARLTAGEFVMPKDVVNWLGQKHFVDTIDNARKGQQKLNQRTDIGGQAAPAIPAPPAFVSRPQQGAIPMGGH